MRRVDALWYQLGFAAVGLGVLVAVVGGGAVPGANVLAGLVSLVGVVAATAGAVLARRRVRGIDPDDPRDALTVPGDQLAARVATGDDDGAVRDALRRLADGGAAEPDGLADAARNDVAAYLRGEAVGPVGRLWARLVGRHPEAVRAARAADAVARARGVAPEPADDGDDGGRASEGDGPTVAAATATATDGGRTVGPARPDAVAGSGAGDGPTTADVGVGTRGTPGTTAAGDDRASGADAGVGAGATDRERSTGRWYGALALAVTGTAVGAFAGSPVVLLAGVVAVGAAAYARIDRTPPPDVAVTRTVSDPAPAAGDRVTVTVTVENVGDETLPELRVRDGVPPGLSVVDGRPAVVTALAPGRVATFAYVVEASRGRHAFGSPTAAVRGFAGTTERRRRLSADPDVVECLPPLPAPGRVPPIVARTVVGPGDATASGDGVEFVGARPYRRGDPASRIDWRRLARTGERVTIRYAEDRRGDVVVLVDARRPAYCARRAAGDGEGDDPTRRTPAVDACVDAAADAATSLLASGYRVGLAAASPREGWLAPGAGDAHRRRVERFLATEPALSRTPPASAVDPASVAVELAARPGGVDAVVVASPLVDDGAVDLVRHVVALGVDVTVLAPDPTRSDTPWRRVARAARDGRVRRLRAVGATVVDRPPGATRAGPVPGGRP